jgi:hypothetical protein
MDIVMDGRHTGIPSRTSISVRRTSAQLYQTLVRYAACCDKVAHSPLGNPNGRKIDQEQNKIPSAQAQGNVEVSRSQNI